MYVQTNCFLYSLLWGDFIYLFIFFKEGSAHIITALKLKKKVSQFLKRSKGDEGKWGQQHGVPHRPVFMCGAVQTHNLQAPVSIPATVAAKEPHYCH